MTTLSNNIKSIDDCWIDDPFGKEYFDFGPGEYDLSPQLSSPMDVNSWIFSPLPSPESPYLDRHRSTYEDLIWEPSDQALISLVTPESTNNEFAASEQLASAAYQNAFINAADYEQVVECSVAPVNPDCVPESKTPANSPDICSPTRSPPQHIRLNHNQVEKQYRNRLNGQFEKLLLALPREDQNVHGDFGEKKVSKAEVLLLAMKHIRDLERDKKRLEEDNERLDDVEDLTERWMESGGVVLP
ncbi:hypothetical protein IFR05_004360 [Cadophora sp. M221]|nr:hypothetical protein IFR05_004360 [Cadophora sp. M221]